MLSLDALGFSAPVLLYALLALPILWWLLRAVPPAPVRRRFAGIALLLGLREDDPESQRTPWWLLVLRIGALAALIVALAGPVLNPVRQAPGQGPLLVVMDASWASARDWPRRIDRLGRALDEAQRAGRPVAVISLTDPPVGGVEFRAAEHWRERLAGLAPRPWAAPAALPDWVPELPEGAETLWISDGLARDGRGALLNALAERGPVQVFEPATPVIALAPATFNGDTVTLTARRNPGPEQALTLLAIGRDPAGVERDLARAPLLFAAGALRAEASFSLPPELRNRITRFQIQGLRGAGTVSLSDDSLRRRKVGLLSVRGNSEALALLSPLHYIREALAPSADLVESASLDDLLLAGPDVIVLADQPGMTEAETAALTDWLEDGGLLLRFAGPRLAGAGAGGVVSGSASMAEDPLLPVALRAGGRTVGGAMSWGDPRSLAPFPDTSPFVGLPVPADVGIRAQVLAQPGPELASRTIAALADGTPLVTRVARGAGQVVLFHVTANAEWSNLPLSGLFVSMLDRLAISTRGSVPDAGELAGTVWQPEEVLDGFGMLHRADDRAAVAGEDLAGILAGDAQPGPALPPGLYAGAAMRLAVNATGATTPLTAATWP
ncbi:MAG: BatA domain-containing protein, partial [Rhodobacteraceae bacterium]|nr:BatA domain-containing protein [Paracoccaceae bacterium]